MDFSLVNNTYYNCLSCKCNKCRSLRHAGETISRPWKRPNFKCNNTVNRIIKVMLECIQNSKYSEYSNFECINRYMNKFFDYCEYNNNYNDRRRVYITNPEPSKKSYNIGTQIDIMRESKSSQTKKDKKEYLGLKLKTHKSIKRKKKLEEYLDNILLNIVNLYNGDGVNPDNKLSIILSEIIKTYYKKDTNKNKILSYLTNVIVECNNKYYEGTK